MGDDLPRIEKLTKSNYALWKFNMWNFMSGKTWNKILDGSATAANTRDWAQYDAKAKTAIGCTLDPEHLSMVIHCETAKEMWDTIIAVKERHSETNKMLATCEWHSYKFRPGISCSEYLAGLNVLKVKLRGLGKNMEDVEVISKVLYDLPREFDNFRENWRLTATENEEMMTMDKFTGHLLASEASNSGRRKAAGSGDAFVSKSRDKRKDKKDVECYNCGKKGHFKAECRSASKNEDHRRNGSTGSKPHGPFQKKKGKGLMARDIPEKEGEWVADSGASFHMTQDEAIITSYKKLETPKKIYIADGGMLEAVGVGQVTCRAHDGDSWYETTVHDVHHVPKLGTTNLFSQRSTAKRGYTVKHDDKTLWIKDADTKEVILVGDCRRSDGLFVLRLETIKAKASTAKAANLKVWHKRLGHTGKQKILQMERQDAANGLEIGDKSDDFQCFDCNTGRMTRLPCRESKGNVYSRRTIVR